MFETGSFGLVEPQLLFLRPTLHLSGQIQQTGNWWYFSYFPQKTFLTFHANCLFCRKFAWNVKPVFLGKQQKKIFQYVVCLKFYQECLHLELQQRNHLGTAKRKTKETLSVVFTLTLLDGNFAVGKWEIIFFCLSKCEQENLDQILFGWESFTFLIYAVSYMARQR